MSWTYFVLWCWWSNNVCLITDALGDEAGVWSIPCRSAIVFGGMAHRCTGNLRTGRESVLNQNLPLLLEQIWPAGGARAGRVEPTKIQRHKLYRRYGKCIYGMKGRIGGGSLGIQRRWGIGLIDGKVLMGSAVELAPIVEWFFSLSDCGRTDVPDEQAIARVLIAKL